MSWVSYTIKFLLRTEAVICKKPLKRRSKMNVEPIFIQAAKGMWLCELIDRSGNKRLVEPYMVYSSGTGKRLLHCYQIQGHSKSGNPQGVKIQR